MRDAVVALLTQLFESLEQCIPMNLSVQGSVGSAF